MFHLQRTGQFSRSLCHNNEILLSNYRNVENDQFCTIWASEEGIKDFFHEVCDSIFEWTVDGKETGIDRIRFEFDTSETQSIVIIHGIQVKTGKDSSPYTSGLFATQRRHLRCARVDDTTVAGILVKAERGFHTFFKADFAPETYQFQIGDFHVMTNKFISAAYNSFKQNHNFLDDFF